MLNEFSLTYLSALSRVLAKIQDKQKEQMPADHQEMLHASIITLISQLENESDADTHFVVMSDLAVLCLVNNQALFLDKIVPQLEKLLSNQTYMF